MIFFSWYSFIYNIIIYLPQSILIIFNLTNKINISRMFKKYREIFLILAGLNVGLLVISMTLGSIDMMLLNIFSIAALILAYELNSED